MTTAYSDVSFKYHGANTRPADTMVAKIVVWSEKVREGQRIRGQV